MARRRKLSDRRARHDTAYQRAKDSGFAARAVFKLEELDQKFRLLSPGRKVLDLGCWPGSWMQYASDRVGEHGLVVGIDLKALEIALPTWCESIVADVYELRPEQLVERYGPFDVVVSDMAPHTIGDRTTDQLRSEELTRRAFEFACGALRPGGHFAAKVFQGGGLKALLTDVQAAFQEGRSFHAQASRTQSRELYVVGRGLKKQGPRS